MIEKTYIEDPSFLLTAEECEVAISVMDKLESLSNYIDQEAIASLILLNRYEKIDIYKEAIKLAEINFTNTK